MEGVYTKASKSAKMAIIGPELIQLPPELLSKLPPWKTKKMWEALDFLPKKSESLFLSFFLLLNKFFENEQKKVIPAALVNFFENLREHLSFTDIKKQ